MLQALTAVRDSVVLDARDAAAGGLNMLHSTRWPTLELLLAVRVAVPFSPPHYQCLQHSLPCEMYVVASNNPHSGEPIEQYNGRMSSELVLLTTQRRDTHTCWAADNTLTSTCALWLYSSFLHPMDKAVGHSELCCYPTAPSTLLVSDFCARSAFLCRTRSFSVVTSLISRRISDQRIPLSTASQ